MNHPTEHQMNAERYRRQAAELRRKSKGIRDKETRHAYETMAQQLDTLAAAAEQQIRS